MKITVVALVALLCVVQGSGASLPSRAELDAAERLRDLDKVEKSRATFREALPSVEGRVQNSLARYKAAMEESNSVLARKTPLKFRSDWQYQDLLKDPEVAAAVKSAFKADAEVEAAQMALRKAHDGAKTGLFTYGNDASKLATPGQGVYIDDSKMMESLKRRVDAFKDGRRGIFARMADFERRPTDENLNAMIAQSRDQRLKDLRLKDASIVEGEESAIWKRFRNEFIDRNPSLARGVLSAEELERQRLTNLVTKTIPQRIEALTSESQRIAMRPTENFGDLLRRGIFGRHSGEEKRTMQQLAEEIALKRQELASNEAALARLRGTLPAGCVLPEVPIIRDLRSFGQACPLKPVQDVRRAEAKLAATRKQLGEVTVVAEARVAQECARGACAAVAKFRESIRHARQALGRTAFVREFNSARVLGASAELGRGARLAELATAGRVDLVAANVAGRSARGAGVALRASGSALRSAGAVAGKVLAPVSIAMAAHSLYESGKDFNRFGDDLNRGHFNGRALADGVLGGTTDLLLGKGGTRKAASGIYKVGAKTAECVREGRIGSCTVQAGRATGRAVSAAAAWVGNAPSALYNNRAAIGRAIGNGASAAGSCVVNARSCASTAMSSMKRAWDNSYYVARSRAQGARREECESTKQEQVALECKREEKERADNRRKALSSAARNTVSAVSNYASSATQFVTSIFK